MNRHIRFILSLSMAGVLSFAPHATLAACKGGVTVSSALIKPGADKCIGSSDQNPIFALIQLFLTYASGVLGIALVLMIVIGGLQYVISDGSPDVTREAKDRIKNAVAGLVLFALMFGALQVILPDGVFHR